MDEKFPRRSAEDWLSKSCKIADDQTNSIKEISEAIENLGADGTDTIGEIFSDRVGTQMDRFSVALDKFTNNIAEILANAQKISDEINKNLLGTLEKLNESLKQDRIKQEEQDEENNISTREITENFESFVRKYTRRPKTNS